jgi:hypothetical protein
MSESKEVKSRMDGFRRKYRDLLTKHDLSVSIGGNTISDRVDAIGAILLGEDVDLSDPNTLIYCMANAPGALMEYGRLKDAAQAQLDRISGERAAWFFQKSIEVKDLHVKSQESLKSGHQKALTANELDAAVSVGFPAEWGEWEDKLFVNRDTLLFLTRIVEALHESCQLLRSISYLVSGMIQSGLLEAQVTAPQRPQNRFFRNPESGSALPDSR